MASSVDFTKSRAFTIALLEAVDNDLVDAREVLQNILCWISERDVKEFCDDIGYFEYDEQE